MTSLPRRILAGLAVFAAAISACQTSSAAPVVWNGAGTDMNWSTPGNWFGNTPPGTGDDVKFFDLGGSSTFGAVNNIVDSTRTNLSLQFANTNNTIVHTTQINPGVTLALTGSGGLINGNETSNDTRVTNTITGAGGRLIISNTVANIQVRQPFNTSSTANRTTLDMSGLDTFNATVARVLVGVAGSGTTLNRATGRLLLARTNIITTSGGAPQIDVSDSNGGSNNGNGSTLSLGQTNALFTDSITIGRARESASTFNFNSAFSSPAVFIRGTNGLSSRVSSWTIGDAAAQTGTIIARGTVNLSAGTIDARVDSLALAQPSLGTTDGSQSAGTLIIGAGILDVNTLTIGNQRTNNAASGLAVMSLTGNATLTVNSNLLLARTIGGAGATTTSGTLNVTNSTVAANAITNAGGGVTAINLNTSTLILTNTAGSATQPIGTISIANSTLQLNAVSGSPAITVNTLTVNGSSDVINVSSVPPGIGQYPLIVFTGLGNQSPDFTTGTLPGGFQGYITNNTSSVDLVITNSALKNDIWRGNVNGDWDTTTLNWSYLGGAVTYQQNDPVIFDDTLTGTPNVTLTTVLTPGGVNVNNSAENYVFSGAGKISGTNGLAKSGSDSLTLNETGGDDFTGGISANGGTLVLNNPNSVAAGGLSISSGATVQIGNNNANGNPPSGGIANNGTLNILRTDNLAINGAITGAGVLNQNGSGTLTLSANNNFSGNVAVNAGTLALTNSGAISNSPNVSVSTAKLDISGVSGVTKMNVLSLNDSVLTLGATNQSIPLNATTLSMGGSGNVINVMALPPIASYPTTLSIVQALGGISGYNATLGTLPAGFTGTLALSPDTTAILLTLTAGPIGQRPSEIWNGADVVNLNTNWSDNLNWQLPGKPVDGDNVIFNNTGAQSSSALSSAGGGINAFVPDFIDNIVDANFNLSSLVYTNFGSSYHNTFINSGEILSVTNSALNIGTLDTGGTAQAEVVTIAGTNGTLNVNGTNVNVQVWLGNATIPGANNNRSTLDLSALGTFNATASRFLIGATIGNIVNRPSGILYLAQTNNLSAAFQTTNSDNGSGTGNAAIDVADCNGNAGADSSIFLGLVNTISADTINIGRQKASGHLLFNPIYANLAPYPTATFKGFSGSRISLLEIGNGVGNSGTTTLNADATLIGGIVTMSVDVLNIGRASGATTGSGICTGTLNFDAGAINANTVNLGVQPVTGSKIGIGSLGVSSNTVIGSQATLTVNGSINLGLAAGGVGGPTNSGTLNITNGTVSANSIVAGTNSVSTINLMGGRLTVATTIGNAAAPLGTLTLAPLNTPDNSNTVLQVPAGLAPSVVVSNLNIDGLDSTTNFINISSVASVTAPAELPIIHYTNLTLTVGATFNLGLGTLPSGYTGYLTNDATLNAIALVVTSTPAPSVPPTIKNIIVAGGNVIITGTNNFGAGGTYHVLTSTNLSLPVTNWTVLTNGTFDSSGVFNTTNALDDTQPRGFYILQVP